MRLDVEVRVPRTGIFNPALTRSELYRFLHDAVQSVTSQLKADWMTNLDRSIRNPTPYYETQVTIQRLSPTVMRVHDRDVVYGPWLEGTSARNRTTRFKGYASFRRATQHTRGLVPAIVGRVVRRNLSRMQ